MGRGTAPMGKDREGQGLGEPCMREGKRILGGPGKNSCSYCSGRSAEECANAPGCSLKLFWWLSAKREGIDCID